ncbi:RNA-directed DNA polymerase [Methanococcoides sp. SA1]|nr:RNA-directed DNA polymerase [Methanococcoides sp. SA1]
MTNKITENEKFKILFDDYFEEGVVPSLSKEEYNTNFKSFKKLKKMKLPYIYDLEHFCNLSNSSSKQIGFYLSHKDKAYSTFNLRKKTGGLREINAPAKNLKHVQRWILDHILHKIDVGTSAHGFVPGRSIVTNASIHVNQDLVLGIDIKDFFPSISANSVYYVFKRVGYAREVSRLLAEVCTHNWRLPQGAPTSPTLANLVALSLDSDIEKYCSKRNFKYSRYADDITISGSSNLPMHKQKILEIIEKNLFIVNEDKTRMFSQGSKQKVTGLVVNDKVSIGRNRKKKIRAIVHNILKNGPVRENRENHPFFKEKIFGELAFVKMVDPEFANPLIVKLKQLDWEDYNKKIEDSKEAKLRVNSLMRKSYAEPMYVNQKIESEDDFFKAITDIFEKLRWYVEDQRWTEAFWNDCNPPTPKKETKIQPTLKMFFKQELNPIGIHVERETHEGIGTLDFKFLITIKGSPLVVCAEFKLAHHKKLEHGLTTQLPLYLKASLSKSGIFLVMWFKDEKEEHFKEPTNKNKSEMLTYLEGKVKEINENEDFKIESILIDASKKPSASQS